MPSFVIRHSSFIILLFLITCFSTIFYIICILLLLLFPIPIIWNKVCIVFFLFIVYNKSVFF